MRILFDHCVPRPLRRYLPGHEIATARAMGWDTLENGTLLAAAEPHFDVMITSDRNSQYQQNLSGRRVALIVLPTNSLPLVIQLAPKIAAALKGLQPGGWGEIL